MSKRGDARIVCAAIRYRCGVIVLGPRHWDDVMRAQHSQMEMPEELVKPEDGFIDQHGNFLDRQAAWKVAKAADQIIYRCGGDDSDGGTLYSENLY